MFLAAAVVRGMIPALEMQVFPVVLEAAAPI
jgi:hypothetical protein